MRRFIYTTDPGSSQMAMNEIKKCIADIQFLDRIGPGVAMGGTEAPFQQVSEIIRENTVFIRHIFPVVYIADHAPAMDMAAYWGSVIDLHKNFLKDRGTFSVQTRLIIGDGQGYTETGLKKNRINEFIARSLQELGYTLDVKAPQQVVSVVIGKDRVYAGVSYTKDNLSAWPGGERRFKKDAFFISRAEFKLLEAMEAFGLEPGPGGAALDLGAAPGGWTKVLLDKRLRVACVDPASLDQRLVSNPSIVHHQCLAQEFLEKNQEKYDIILNDMKMDAFESIGLMHRAFDHLNTGGIGIITLKLRQSHTQVQLNKALKIIGERFCVLHARQLYHNRSEVTVVLGRTGNE